MTLPEFIRERLFRMVCSVMVSRKPDFTITHDVAKGPKMERWHILKTKLLSIYVHDHLQDDDPRALHDHVGNNISLVLEGGYTEVTLTGMTYYGAGEIIFRRAATAHRLIATNPTMTLWIVGPRFREWGWLCPHGWIPWYEFADPTDPGKIGPGCGV